MRLRTCLRAIIIAAMGCPTAKGLLIDDFSTGPRSLSATGETRTDVAPGLDPATTLGGSRYVSVRSLSPAQGAAEVEVGQGQFRFTNASGTLSYFTLGYGDYSFNGSVAPLHLNLTADGADRFALDVVDYDSGGGTGSGTTVVLWIRHAGSGAGSIYRAVALENLTAGRHFVPFSAFTNLPLNDVLGLGLDAGRAPIGRELILSRIATVPEPAGAALVVAAAALVAGRRRRMPCATASK